MSLFAIDVQHRGKPTSFNDRGAVNSDGINEVMVTSMMAESLDTALRNLGHSVFVGMAGTYSERHSYVNTVSADYYFALHMNAGANAKFDRGYLFYDYRSTRGKDLAEKLAVEMSRRLGYSVEAASCRPDTNGTARDADYAEAFNCIAGVKAVALCFEPGFLDGKTLQPLLKDVVRRGQFCYDVAASVCAMFD
jgi:N-acetylmuramoyl-L-alanine amidase